MKFSHIVFKIIWFTSILLLIFELIIGAISLSFIIFKIENALIFRLNPIIIPIICILFLFLIFFYPTFYKNRKNPNFTFISKHETIRGTNFYSQIGIDLLFGNLFFFLIFLFLTPLIFYGILDLDLEVVRFGGYASMIIFFDLIIISIKYYKLYLKFFSSFVLFSSVFAIIIAPMLIFVGIPFVIFYFYDTSWYFADPTILLNDLISSHATNLRDIWLNAYLESSFIYSEAFLIIKMIIFLAGLIFFTVSITQLIYWLKKEKNLVQKGIYKYIRHPQNMAIIIMAFPFFIWYSVRIGDIVTWVQFVFLMILYSDFGDLKLNQKYPDEFQNYYLNTGFFLPKAISIKSIEPLSIFKNKKLRYIILVLIYVLTIIILYVFYRILPFHVSISF
ncbi:MAG: hypothetical protein ACFFCV_06270 [Promethearchaeota archaeon]